MRSQLAAFELMKTTLEHERPLRSLPAAVLEPRLSQGLWTTHRSPAAGGAESRRAGGRPADASDVGREARPVARSGTCALGQCGGRNRQHGCRGSRRFLEDLGLKESALARFIRTAYGLLDLISFFTVGRGRSAGLADPARRHARQAAGRIHSDLERGFIRAEVIPYEVFTQHGSEQAVKDAGRLQIEGKDYVVADGDILHMRFNV